MSVVKKEYPRLKIFPFPFVRRRSNKYLNFKGCKGLLNQHQGIRKMKFYRKIVDTLIIVLSTALLVALYVTLNWYFPLFQNYSIILSVFVGICFVIYGWLIRRWFVKNPQNVADAPLMHTLMIMIPYALTIVLFSIVVNLSSLQFIDVLVLISDSLILISQIVLISLLTGMFLYSSIENSLGPLLFKEKLQEDEEKLGLGMVRKQTSVLMKKQWKYGMIMLWFLMQIANFLVFIVFPSITPEDVSSSLFFSYPNFSFSFNNETGFYQEFFSSVLIPSSAFINWKLIQSLLCLTFLGAMILLIFLPKKKITDNHSTLPEEMYSSQNFDSEDPTELTHKILSTSNIPSTDYLPSNLIKPQSTSKFSNLLKRMKGSDIIPVLNLASLNLVLALAIVSLFTQIGIITYYSSDIFQDLYVQLTGLYWAGLAEEISFRFLLYGVPLFVIYGISYVVYYLYRRLKSNKDESKELSKFQLRIKSKLTINPFLYLTGRWKQFGILDTLFLLISSFGFGYAHYQFSPDYWGTWKIFQAGVAGLIFGYAYFKYGLHAAIILHTINDFVLGLLLTPNLGLILDGAILFFVVIFLGALYLLYLIEKALSASFKLLNTILRRGQVSDNT